MFGLLFTPIFYVLVRWIGSKVGSAPRTAPGASARAP
jgi:hypothetical protein